MHWRRTWQPTPVFLPGESQGRESLVGCRLWGRTESDTQGTLRGLLQHHSSKASILQHSAFFIVQLSHPYMMDSQPLDHRQAPIMNLLFMPQQHRCEWPWPSLLLAWVSCGQLPSNLPGPLRFLPLVHRSQDTSWNRPGGSWYQEQTHCTGPSMQLHRALCGIVARRHGCGCGKVGSPGCGCQGGC